MKRLARVIRGVRCWVLVLVAPLYMLVLVIVLPVVLIPWFGAQHASMRLRDARFRRRLAALGRTRTWEDLGRAPGAPRGTLIVEERSLGWTYTRVWWTPEDVHEQAGRAGVPVLPIEDQLQAWSESGGVASAFTYWCAKRFIGESPSQAFHVEDLYGRSRVDARFAAVATAANAPPVVAVITGTIRRRTAGG